MSYSTLKTVLSRARETAIPDMAEVAQMEETASTLKERAETELASRGYENVTLTQTGSTARGTWVAGDRDIDLFLEFPSETPEETLETVGLEVGEAILPDSKRDFASHPYTKGTFNGFEVDIVPCFSVETASDIKSAVDRTPFHTRFLRDELSPEQCDEVRVAKKFLKGIGVYGSDVNTEGFSGYLTELFILEYGSFSEFLTAAASWWSFPLRVEVADTDSTASFDSQIVVIDPTDPERNVADALSIEKASEFQYYAREFIKNPSFSFFETEDETRSAEELRRSIEQRGTQFVGLLFETPNTLVEDTLVPQLRKTKVSTEKAFENYGFSVVDSFVGTTDEQSIIVIELKEDKLPKMKKHYGPPVSMQEPSQQFINNLSETAKGPFIEEERLVARVEREFAEAYTLLESESYKENVSIGADLGTVFEEREVVSINNNTQILNQFAHSFTEAFNALPASQNA